MRKGKKLENEEKKKVLRVTIGFLFQNLPNGECFNIELNKEKAILVLGYSRSNFNGSFS